jgi:hypothetical protein
VASISFLYLLLCWSHPRRGGLAGHGGKGVMAAPTESRLAGGSPAGGRSHGEQQVAPRAHMRGPSADRGRHRLTHLRAGLWAWLGARRGLDARPWPVGAAPENCRARGSSAGMGVCRGEGAARASHDAVSGTRPRLSTLRVTAGAHTGEARSASAGRARERGGWTGIGHGG